jgi:hypothetical protein
VDLRDGRLVHLKRRRRLRARCPGCREDQDQQECSFHALNDSGARIPAWLAFF